MIYVDTSFWVALRLRRDAHHHEALRLLRQHGDQRLVTSDDVRRETWTFRSWTPRASPFMRARRMRSALAFDGDFSAAGFTELRARASPRVILHSNTGVSRASRVAPGAAEWPASDPDRSSTGLGAGLLALTEGEAER